MLYTYIKTVSNSIEQQQYWTVADSDLQLRGGGGGWGEGRSSRPWDKRRLRSQFFFPAPPGPSPGSATVEEFFCTLCTWTSHRCIFFMSAISHAPSVMRTIFNWTFTAGTTHIVQPNFTASSTKVCRTQSSNRIRKTQMLTNDASIIHVPVIITNSSPLAIVEYFHSSFSVPASTNQS